MTNAGRIRLGDNWRVRPDQLSYDSLPPANQTPRALYNGMLHSLDGVAARGALWYQGESNAGSDADASAYAQQLQSLVGVIRQLTGDTLLPFVAVELPEHLPASSDPIEANGSWARLRQSTRAVSSMPQASSVVTFGYGNPGDIHPREKRPIGKMLAVEMERLAFGKTSGPRFPVATELTQTGQMLTVRFEHVGTGLRAEDDQPLRGFAVRDTSGAWHFAQAEVIGKDRIRIVGPVGLSIDSVAYAWSNNPVGVNLVNGDQMRAGSFLLTLAE